jgi:hypothetical protein
MVRRRIRPLLRLLVRCGAPVLLGIGLVPPGPAGGTVPGPLVVDTSVPPSAAAPAMAAAGVPYAGWVAAGRQFLAFDPAGDGRAIEVIGDLARADRVVVLVPGVGARLADFDRGLGGVARRAPAQQARAIFGKLRALDPGARVAVVAWLGYDPPDGLGLDAARDASAARGADALVDFVAAITTPGTPGRTAGARPTPRLTMVGHSYGAVVIARAAARLARLTGPAGRTTDLVALGAPGMGVGRAADLRTAARVWAGEAERDWIRRVPGVRLFGLGHGRHPADPRFGARPLPVAGVSGHDGYLVPGSPTLRAVALIALGRGAEVSR